LSDSLTSSILRYCNKATADVSHPSAAVDAAAAAVAVAVAAVVSADAAVDNGVVDGVVLFLAAAVDAAQKLVVVGVLVVVDDNIVVAVVVAAVAIMCICLRVFLSIVQGTGTIVSLLRSAFCCQIQNHKTTVANFW